MTDKSLPISLVYGLCN